MTDRPRLSVEPWTIAATQVFLEDMAHAALLSADVDPWIANIQRNPFCGERVEANGGVFIHDYAVSNHVIRFMIVPSTRHLELLTLRSEDEPAGGRRPELERAWRLVVDAATVIGGVRR